MKFEFDKDYMSLRERIMKKLRKKDKYLASNFFEKVRISCFPLSDHLSILTNDVTALAIKHK